MITPSQQKHGCPVCGAGPGELCNLAARLGAVEYIHIPPDRVADYVQEFGRFSPPIKPGKMVAVHVGRKL